MTNETNWYGPEVATFGDRVAAARESAGMTQAVLAKRLGVRLSTLRNWENDISEPRANRLSTLAGLLNVSMVWLMSGEGEGVQGPDAEGDNPAELQDVMAELRSLRSSILRTAEEVGRLEKRVRSLVSDV